MTQVKFNSQLGTILFESSHFSRSGSIREVLVVICSVAVDITGSHGGGVWLVCGRQLRRCVMVNPSEHSQEDAVFDIGRGPAGRAAATGGPVISDDMSTDPTVNQPGLLRLSGVRSCLTVPLTLDSETVGVISVFTRLHPKRYSEQDIRRLQAFCELAALAIDHCLRRPEVTRNWSSFLNRWKSMMAQLHKSPDDASPPPKTISAGTLGRIQHYMRSTGKPVDCRSISESVEVCPATARRYVEYMVKVGLANMTLEYGRVGRPKHQYFL